VAVAVTPVAVVLSKKLVAHLALKSPAATLILPALLPVALSLGMASRRCPRTRHRCRWPW